MAAPSRSINYRTGAPVEIDMDEFMAVIRALKELPKEANRDLRSDARVIADTIIKPIVIKEILRHAPTIGPKLAQSVRSAGDRIPKVVVGKARMPYYGGHKGRTRSIGPQPAQRQRDRAMYGASTNMLRYGTIMGVYARQAGTTDPSGRFRSRGEQVNWPKNVVTPGWTKAASDAYMRPTFNAWEKAVQEICQDWLRGRYGK